MQPRRLIVNADDFGQSAGISRGILQAHDEGIVTSASLMVRWPGAKEAVEAARSWPRMSVGLHVDLGEWRLEAGEWGSVYEVVSPDDTRAVKTEIARQLEAFHRLVGRSPTHLDSHQHVHRQQPVRSLLIEVADELHVPLRHFTPHVQYCGAFYGQDEHGKTLDNILCMEHFRAILDSLQPGCTELACHPAATIDVPTMYRSERLQELAVLCDPRVKQAIASLDIELCSFKEVRP